MVEYPGGVYSPRTKENKSGVVYDAAKKTIVYVEDITKLDDEVVALETYLGLPAGQAGKFLIVNGTEDGLEFTDVDLSGKANIALDNLSGVAINASLVPAVDSAINLGSATKFWANAYIDKIYIGSTTNSIYLYFGSVLVDGGKLRVRLTDTKYVIIEATTNYIDFLAGVPLRFNFSGSVYPRWDSNTMLGTSTNYWLETYTDKLFLNATAILDGAIAGQITLTGHFIPATTLTEDLGSSSNFWDNIFVENIYIRGSQQGMKSVAANQVLVGKISLDDGVILGDVTGDALIMASSGLSDITFNDLIFPFVDSSYDLGKSTNYWANAYIDKLFLNATAILDGATAGHILFTGDLVPATDDLEWIGQLESPFKAIKGLVIKDTTDGKHYKVEVVNGVLTTTALD